MDTIEVNARAVNVMSHTRGGMFTAHGFVMVIMLPKLKVHYQ